MVRRNVASLMHLAVMFANDVESPPRGTSSSLRWRQCRCWWCLPWTHLRGDAQVVIIAPVQQRHGDCTVHLLTRVGVSGGSMSLPNIQPCCLFLFINYSDLCHLQQFRCPQIPLKIIALISPSIHLFHYLPSFQPDMVLISICLFWGRRAKEEPRQLWSNNSLSAESSLYSKLLRSKSDFQAVWIEGTF